MIIPPTRHTCSHSRCIFPLAVDADIAAMGKSRSPYPRPVAQGVEGKNIIRQTNMSYC